MTKIKVGNAVVCEFIADGLNRKVTLVNAISGNIGILEFPAIIMLAFYIEVISDETGVFDAAITIKLGKNNVGKIPNKLMLVAGEIGLIILPSGMLQIAEETEIKVSLSADRISPITLVRRKIVRGSNLNPAPTA